MANGPIIHQMCVILALRPVRRQCPQLYIIHYMDDILLASDNSKSLFEAFAELLSNQPGKFLCQKRYNKCIHINI